MNEIRLPPGTITPHLGSVTLMTLPSGALHRDGTAQYQPFGGFQQPPAANPGFTRQGYTGHQHHNTGEGDIGLIYMNARYYLPDIGRFASPDIFVMDLANPASLNRYSYVGNNPLRYTDPDGHCWPLCTAIAGAVIGGLIGGVVQAVHNIRHDMPLTADVGKAFTVGAVAGAIGGATFGAGTAVLGTGFTATVVSGAISGAVAGQASVATDNTLNNQPLTQDLGNPHDLVRDAAIGGVLAGAVYGISKGVQALSSRNVTAPVGMLEPAQIRYTDKVVSQMRPGDYTQPRDFHGFPREKESTDERNRTMGSGHARKHGLLGTSPAYCLGTAPLLSQNS